MNMESIYAELPEMSNESIEFIRSDESTPMSSITSKYEVVIRPATGWAGLGLADVWRYRDLMLLLVHRDFVAKYKQTVLGPVWFIIQPLLTTVVFTVVFSQIAQISTDGTPPVLFYLAGLLCWNYFAQTFQTISQTFVTNASMFGKVYFPRLVVPIAAVISNLIAFGIQFATFALFWVYYKAFTDWGANLTLGSGLILFPMVVLQVGLFSLAVGLWLSAATAKYRDFAFLTGFIIQMWMYATPVIFPLSRVPENYRWLIVLNPMTMPVELSKKLLLGEGLATTPYVMVSVVTTLLLLVSGILVFNRVERTFVDVI